MYRQHYNVPDRHRPMWAIILIIMVLIGLMIYVTRHDDPHEEAVAVAEEVREAPSPYQLRKEADERMARRIAAAYTQGRQDAIKDGCVMFPALSMPVK